MTGHLRPYGEDGDDDLAAAVDDRPCAVLRRKRRVSWNLGGARGRMDVANFVKTMLVMIAAAAAREGTSRLTDSTPVDV